MAIQLEQSRLDVNALAKLMQTSARRAASEEPTGAVAAAQTGVPEVATTVSDDLFIVLADFNRLMVRSVATLTATATRVDDRIEALESRLHAEIDRLTGRDQTLQLQLETLQADRAADVAGLQARMDVDSHTRERDAAEHASLLAYISEHVVDLLRRVQESEAELQQVIGATQELRVELLRLDNRARAAEAEHTLRLSRSLRGATQPTQARPVPSSRSARPQFDYFLFEQRFRGSPQVIKARQTVYAKFFDGPKTVLDLGCGRGEFLELMAERGVTALGIDSSQAMVEFCQAKGLHAIEADILSYLDGRAPASLDGIFAAQVVEHFPPDDIWQMLQLCQDKLAPGGTILLETVNPACPIAMGNFYVDPTHVRPVPAHLLEFMLEDLGFVTGTFVFSSPIPESDAAAILECVDVPPAASLYQDYAIVGSVGAPPRSSAA